MLKLIAAVVEVALADRLRSLALVTISLRPAAAGLIDRYDCDFDCVALIQAALISTNYTAVSQSVSQSYTIHVYMSISSVN